MSVPAQLIRRRMTKSLLEAGSVAFIETAADALVRSLRGGGTVLLCGNGGSAVDATHIAAEMLGRFRLERAPLAAVCPADNVSAVTAIGNEHTFRQLAGLGRPGDVLIALSTSVNSGNVLAAARVTRERGLVVIGVTGAGSGELAALCDRCFCAASEDTARIQEVHMVAGHELVEQELGESA